MNADYIIKSDNIFISSHRPCYDGQIAIKDGKICFLGKNAIEWKGTDTKELDYKGKTVCPGFIDSHTHVLLAALQGVYTNLNDCQSEEDTARKLYEDGRNPADNGWIFGFGWTYHQWSEKTPPTKNSLDKFFKDTPVALLNEELHSLWVNSKALEICGINRDTPDVASGKIERDKEGNPTGYLLEFEAMKKVTKKAFDFGLDYLVDITKGFLTKCSEFGITGVSDIQYLCTDMAPVYKELERRGCLSAKINLSYPLTSGVELIKEQKEKYTTDLISINSLKAFLDGTPACGNGYLLDPYCNIPGFCSEPLLSLDYLTEEIIKATKAGFQVRFHACGDGAVRLALDAYEAAAKVADIKELRHTVEHIEVIAENDIKRFGELGVIPSVQPEHMFWSDLESHPFIEILGADRCRFTWPFQSLLKQNGYCGFGTDCPVVALNPYEGIHRAVYRQLNNGLPSAGWNPEQRLSLVEAIHCYTMGSAMVLHLEEKCGSLDCGKSADLVVLNRNIFECQGKELKKTRPLLTMVDGKIIFKV